MHASHATAAYRHHTTAPAHAIWPVLTKVSAWKEWNAGVQACTIDAPFAHGAWLTMTLPDGEVLRSQLIDVHAPTTFTDETTLGDVVVRVKHAIATLADGQSEITYSVDVSGENAHDICAGVSSDFPDVLAKLAERAERVSLRA